MSNPFIERYTAEQALGKDCVSAMNAALEDLKEAWQTKLDGLQQHATAREWRGFFKGSLAKPRTLNAPTIQLEALETLQSALQQLTTPYDLSAVSMTLGTHFHALSQSKQARELLEHLIKDIGSSHASLRGSMLIQPEPMSMLLGEAPPHEAGQEWTAKLKELLAKKQLESTLFTKKAHDSPTLQHPISEHARWAYANIYKVEYPGSRAYTQETPIARSLHGIQHVSRVALYVPVLANLFRKYNDPEALVLNEEDIQLLQIAALFHDSAREDDGEDRWDHESALLLYCYLTRIVGVDPIKAKLIAEATANKDPDVMRLGYFEITEVAGGGQLTWQFRAEPNPVKNIYQKIIHDADCLDIIRVRPHFQADYLDFFKEVACKHPDAFEAMAHLITEVRSLIALGGDTFKATQLLIKKDHEQEDGYLNMQSDVKLDLHPILYALHAELLSQEALSSTPLYPQIPPYHPAMGLTEENMRSAINEGKVFVRGIAEPSTLVDRRYKQVESAVHLDVRKTMRAIGIPTQTPKENREKKQGNPVRSVSLIGYGASVFANAGALIVNPRIEDCREISAVNINSGFGKKKDRLASKLCGTSPIDQQQKLMAVFNQLKKGGQDGDKGYSGTHVEIIYDVTRWDAIYYCEDPNESNRRSVGDGCPKHPYAPILQAIMLRKEYEQQYQETKEAFIFHQPVSSEAMFYERFGPTGLLPIFHYSGLHHQMEIIPENELSDDKVVDLWVAMCSDFITESLHQGDASDIESMSINDIKVMAMYGELESSSPNFRGKTLGAADMNYSEELQQKINMAIETQRARLIQEDTENWWEQVKSEERSLVDDRVFYNLLEDPSLRALFPDAWIKKAIINLTQSPTWFQSSLRNKLFKWDCDKFGWSSNSIIKLCARPRSDLLISASEKEQTMFFENQAVRLYAICQLFRNDDLMQLIQEKGIALVLARIERIKQSIHFFSGKLFPDLMNELTQLDYFSKVFDIDQKLKIPLDDMKNEVFKQISVYPYLRDGDVTISHQYLPSIKLLQQLHWFNPSIHMTPAKQALALFATQLTGTALDQTKTSRGIVIDDYLELCSLLKQAVDKEAIKAFSFNNLRLLKSHFLIGYHSGFRNIPTYLPLTDENNDLFTIMASSCDSSSLEQWLTYLKALEKITPNQKFSENQCLILEKELDAFADNTLKYQLLGIERLLAFATPAALHFMNLCEKVDFCTSIQAMKTPLKIPLCILQSLLHDLNQYAALLPSPPEHFISQKDHEQLQHTLILRIERMNQTLSIPNPELSAVIERIKANPSTEATLAMSPKI